MSTQTPEELEFIRCSEAADERFHNSLIAFTIAVGESLEDLCSYGLTIGEAYVPFDPDDEDECEEGEAFCTQAWVRVTAATPIMGIESFGGECAAVLSVTLEVGVLRCFEIEEDGEAPKASDVMVGAIQSMADMTAIYRAAMREEVWDSITSGSWSPLGPTGGQFGGIWTFTVEI